MNKKSISITLGLIFALFVYIFYRTEWTVVNRWIVYIIGNEYYLLLRNWVQAHIQLDSLIIYSLPEGLWVFAVTYLSVPYSISIYRKKIALFYLPILYAIGLEFLQLWGWTYGVYDFFDIALSILFWTLALVLNRARVQDKNILTCWDINSIACLSCYSIVYLSHVCK